MRRLNKGNNSTTEISHKMVALRLVNERMTDIALATSDGNIGAVAIFAGFEVRSAYYKLGPLAHSTNQRTRFKAPSWSS
jgi:hypothetical protein